MKDNFSQNEQEKNPKGVLDFEGIRVYILSYLKENLDSKLCYHSLSHTLNVEAAVIAYSKEEKINDRETVLLKTAALFHDCGYTQQYKKNEPLAVSIIADMAPKYGFTKDDISFMSSLILATSRSHKPKNIFEQIICDADHDYLGNSNYHELAALLCKELIEFGEHLTEKEWISKQIDYLEFEHKYYTQSAILCRQKEKEKRVLELKEQLLNFEK